MQKATIRGRAGAWSGSSAPRSSLARARVATRAFVPDLQHISDAGALEHIARHVGSHFLTLGDVSDAAGSVAQAVEPVVKAAGSGPFDFLAKGFENFLTTLDGGLERFGVPYSYGFAIILLTILVKLGTYPLTKKQVESTVSMQALQPRVKDLQARYTNDPERLQMETAKLYKDAGVNPLAGCLPTLATIPVFIGLYRALTLAAQDGLLSEGFFWIPSLGGPTTVDQQLAGTGLSWLWPWVDGQPPLGWEQTIAYLIMPVLLTISQSVSQKIISPPSDDPAQQQTQAVLKFIPLLIGWFSLNVPSGLTLYWFTNNILTTAQQVYLKGEAKAAVALPSSSAATRNTSNGFGSSQATDAESSARKSKGEKFRARQSIETGPLKTVADARGKKRKGEKFRKRKEQELGGNADSSASLKAEDSVAVEAGAGESLESSNGAKQ